jgi:hypothetical protein
VTPEFIKASRITMNQPIAIIANKDIKRIILRDYGGKSDEVLKYLSEYVSENEKFRVWAALLKISNGSVAELRKNILLANVDYRDVLAEAEYPIYTKKVGFDSKKFSKNELEKIIKSDFEQYKEWLQKSDRGWFLIV